MTDNPPLGKLLSEHRLGDLKVPGRQRVVFARSVDEDLAVS